MKKTKPNDSGLRRSMFSPEIVGLAVSYDAQAHGTQSILDKLAPIERFPAPEIDFDQKPSRFNYETAYTL